MTTAVLAALLLGAVLFGGYGLQAYLARAEAEALAVQLGLVATGSARVAGRWREHDVALENATAYRVRSTRVEVRLPFELPGDGEIRGGHGDTAQTAVAGPLAGEVEAPERLDRAVALVTALERALSADHGGART